MRCRLFMFVIASLIAGCSKTDGPTNDGKFPMKGDASNVQPRPQTGMPDPSIVTPPITSTAKFKGQHGGTMVELLPDKIDVEVLVDENDDLVIVLGILKATLIQDLSFVAKTGEGAMEKEVFRGNKSSQFGISESWTFKSSRLIELLKQGRDGKVTLNATSQSGTQAPADFLAIEITWPAKKKAQKK